MAWIIKKLPVANNSILESTLEIAKTKNTQLETSNQYLLDNKHQLEERAINLTKEITEANKLVTAYSTRNEWLTENITALNENDRKVQERFGVTSAALTNAENKNHQYTTELRFKDEQLNTQKDQLVDIGKKFEDQFTILAQKILEEKTTSFNIFFQRVKHIY